MATITTNAPTRQDGYTQSRITYDDRTVLQVRDGGNTGGTWARTIDPLGNPGHWGLVGGSRGMTEVITREAAKQRTAKDALDRAIGRVQKIQYARM